ncbi:MAG: glycosyltransferase [Acidimicrobiales bacterium]
MTDRFHVLHVSQPTSAGVAVCVRDLATHQRHAGHRVTVACPSDGELGDWCRADDVDVRTWQAGRSPGPALADEVRSLAAIIEATDPDVVHLHSSKAGLAGRLAVRGRRPTIVHPNAWSFLPPGPQQGPARLWERFGARWTDLFLMAGDDELAMATEARIAGTFTVIPNGVDVDAFTPATRADQVRARAELDLADAPTAVCVGRLCEQKGQDLLLEAWAEVLEQVPEARLVLVGDGELASELRAVAGASVHFAGRRSDVWRWYAAADVAVQASRWEGLSFATLEALSSGRPVVAFDAPGMRQAIGDAGTVVPTGNVGALGRALVGHLRDLDRCAAQGALGAGRVRAHFDRAVLSSAVTTATAALLQRRSQ